MNAKLRAALASRNKMLDDRAREMGITRADLNDRLREHVGPYFITAEAVATSKGVSVSAVKNACNDGTLRATKLGRAWMIDLRDVVKWTPRKVGWAKGRRRSVAP